MQELELEIDRRLVSAESVDELRDVFRFLKSNGWLNASWGHKIVNKFKSLALVVGGNTVKGSFNGHDRLGSSQLGIEQLVIMLTALGIKPGIDGSLDVGGSPFKHSTISYCAERGEWHSHY